MLLPGMVGVAGFVTAVEGERGLVVGAAAITHSRRHKPPTGPGAAVHVIPPCRSHGVGRALVATMAQYAARCGDDAIYSARKVDMASEEFAAWRGLGFEAVETVEEHELSVAEFAPRLAPLVAWLREHGRIPSEARIVPLYAADRQQVLEFHMAHLGGDRDVLRARLHGQGNDAFHPRYSRVLCLGERVVGCVLAHRTARDAAAVDAVIVAPELRNDWANAWLKLEACQGAQAIGVVRFHFSSFDHYQDTRRFAAQLGGMTTRTWALMARSVDGSPIVKRDGSE